MNARSTDATELFKDACAGDRAALARLLSLIERGGDDARSVGRLVYPKIGKGYVVGLTGAPGAATRVPVSGAGTPGLSRGTPQSG